MDIIKQIQVILLISFCLSYVRSEKENSSLTWDSHISLELCTLPKKDLDDLPNSFLEVRKFIECEQQTPEILKKRIMMEFLNTTGLFHTQIYGILRKENQRRHAVQDKIIHLSGNTTSPEIQACLKDKNKAIDEALDIGENHTRYCLGELKVEINFMYMAAELSVNFEKEWNSTLADIDKCLGKPSSPQNKEKLKCAYEKIENLLVKVQNVGSSEVVKQFKKEVSNLLNHMELCGMMGVVSAQDLYLKTHLETVKCFGPVSDPSVLVKAFEVTE
ncbi:hypothetical protein L9F63_017864 [Diploptera punctata]|uniref:Uncharacterized protein n=1 Tax=Diploptera punctata TaxID=6984 RepID=A0AAD7ZYM7_DIPPU|nr:hypothetical protein L9F63_017864 [Diploptera punctata]